jgi:hypothetical protein
MGECTRAHVLPPAAPRDRANRDEHVPSGRPKALPARALTMVLLARRCPSTSRRARVTRARQEVAGTGQHFPELKYRAEGTTS